MRRKVLLGLAIGLTSSSLFASTFQLYEPCQRPFYILLGTGYSYSQNADISVTSAWDPAIQGYNATLGNSPVYTAGLGYRLSKLIDIDIEVNRRPSYSYNKFQTPIPGTTSPGPVGINARKFDFDSTSGMVNVFINGLGANLLAQLNPCITLSPFVGVGAGIAYNTVSNFHSVLATSPSPGFNDVASIMHSQTETSFAWQAVAGLSLIQNNTWGIDLGYKYFDGGDFKSNNYLLNVPSGFTQPITAPAWKGQFTANEVFLNGKYYLG